jgi:hypothetical protein
MTSPLIPVPGHEFARDRAPVDDPLAQWRYRWNCSCGAAGRWQTVSVARARRHWRQHLKKLRQRTDQCSGRRNDTDARTP